MQIGSNCGCGCVGMRLSIVRYMVSVMFVPTQELRDASYSKTSLSLLELRQTSVRQHKSFVVENMLPREWHGVCIVVACGFGTERVSCCRLLLGHLGWEMRCWEIWYFGMLSLGGSKCVVCGGTGVDCCCRWYVLC